MWNIPPLFICLFMCLLVCVFKNRFSGSRGWFFLESSLSQRCLSLVWFSLCRVTTGPLPNNTARRRFLLGSFRAPSILQDWLRHRHMWRLLLSALKNKTFGGSELFSARSFGPPENLSELPTVRSKTSRTRDAGTRTGHSAGQCRNWDNHFRLYFFFHCLIYLF